MGVAGQGRPPFLERADELAALDAAMDRLVGSRGSLLLVEGPAGIGKTRLLREAVVRADHRGVLVRQARGGELEREMPFALARQLFEPVVVRASEADRARLFAGSAELALAALGQQVQDTDSFGAIHGLYWLVANLAEDQPLMLVVDDAHWADPQTLRFVDYLSRRLDDVAALVVVAARPGEPDEAAGLGQVRVEAAHMFLRPLTAPAVAGMVAGDLGALPAPEFVDACMHATGGNPFLVAEVVRAIQAEGLAPDAAAIAAVTDIGPEAVARRVLIRLARFGDDVVALARAIALLGHAPQLRHAAELAALTDDKAGDACDRLREAQILLPGRPIEFVHPLVRSAIYRDLSEEVRSGTHRRAAALLAASGSAPTEVAAHLMACAPNGDAWVVEQLRRAALDAMATGAASAARLYLERALTEPPDDEAAVLLELGRALLVSDPGHAPATLERAAKAAPAPAQRVTALGLAVTAELQVGNLRGCVQRCLEALDAGPDREMALAVEAAMHVFRVVSVGRDGTATARIEAVAMDASTATPGGRVARQALAFDRFCEGAPVGEVIALAEPFPPFPWEIGGIPNSVPLFAVKVLVMSGAADAARGTLAAYTDWTRRRDLIVVSYVQGALSEADRLSGSLSDAEANARTAWDLAVEAAPFSAYGWQAILNLLATLVARGDLDGVATLAADMDLSGGPPEIPINPWPLEIRGLWRLAQGDMSGGTEDLLAFGARLEAMGLRNPALSPWRQEVGPALAALGRTAEARQVIVEAERRARTFGAPHVLGAVLRSRGLIEPRGSQLGTLEESAALLERSGPPHELGRSLLELGAALRRAGQRTAARQPLRRALDLLDRCGAGGLAERAREELTAAGARPRRAAVTGVASLTASELRTARLAAGGLNNREIAERLFVTRRTVETHLTHVYAKLAIERREELPAALAADHPG